MGTAAELLDLTPAEAAFIDLRHCIPFLLRCVSHERTDEYGVPVTESTSARTFSTGVSS